MSRFKLEQCWSHFSSLFFHVITQMFLFIFHTPICLQCQEAESHISLHMIIQSHFIHIFWNWYFKMQKGLCYTCCEITKTLMLPQPFYNLFFILFLKGMFRQGFQFYKSEMHGTKCYQCLWYWSPKQIALQNDHEVSHKSKKLWVTGFTMLIFPSRL